MFVELPLLRSLQQVAVALQDDGVALPRPELRDLLEDAVAHAFEVDVHSLRKPTRGRARIALARQTAMYLAHVTCGLTLTDVGVLFDRDRTTVAYACRVVEGRRDDEDFDRAVETLEQVLCLLVDCVLTGETKAPNSAHVERKSIKAIPRWRGTGLAS